MSNRSGFTVVAALLMFGSALRSAGAEPTTGTGIRSIESERIVADAARTQAPIGHRQPRPSDTPPSGGLSRVEAELQRLDVEVDRKLIICRGC